MKFAGNPPVLRSEPYNGKVLNRCSYSFVERCKGCENYFNNRNFFEPICKNSGSTVDYQALSAKQTLLMNGRFCFEIL